MKSVLAHLKYKINEYTNDIARCERVNLEWKNSWPSHPMGDYEMVDKDVIDGYRAKLKEFKAAYEVLHTYYENVGDKQGD